MYTTKKKWFAVYTRPRWEKKVSELLDRKCIENYCPLNKVRRQWSDRTKIILEPLFTSYVFVNITELDQLEVRKTDGIINFVYFLSKPAVIRNDEIDAIKLFLARYEGVKLNKTNVNINDYIQITDGPLIHLEGNVLEVRNRTIIVTLPSLGYNLIAEIKRDNIKVVPPHSKPLVRSIL